MGDLVQRQSPERNRTADSAHLVCGPRRHYMTLVSAAHRVISLPPARPLTSGASPHASPRRNLNHNSLTGSLPSQLALLSALLYMWEPQRPACSCNPAAFCSIIRPTLARPPTCCAPLSTPLAVGKCTATRSAAASRARLDRWQRSLSCEGRSDMPAPCLVAPVPHTAPTRLPATRFACRFSRYRQLSANRLVGTIPSALGRLARLSFW